MKRLVCVVLLASSLMAIPVGGAAADPKTEPLWLECTGVPSGWITSNGNGLWTPGLASAGTGVHIPYAFEFELWFTPEGGEEQLVGTESYSKRAPRNGHPHGVCTFGETFQVVDDPELGTGTGRFEGVAWVSYTG
ncbi:MAG: hypothetical protein HKN41_06615 [Ilumatobacter sp.]|nr:hypothetical protein [Ilumatobacter sp.]